MKNKLELILILTKNKTKQKGEIMLHLDFKRKY